MKKFFVGLLGLFLLTGVSLLTACGVTRPSLTVSQDHVEVELLYSGDDEGGYQTITAQVFDSDDGITATTSAGYESYIKVSSEPLTNGQYLITIQGLNEGYAEFNVSVNGSNVSKTVTVEVYSEVTSMEQKVEETTKKNNFAIRGDSVNLIEDNLIKFSPSQNSRRNLTWSLVTGTTNASIEGTVLTLGDDFEGDTIMLEARTDNESVEPVIITLDVIDKIEVDLMMEWSYSENTDFEPINSETSYRLVPNYPNDIQSRYDAFININYLGELDITPVVLTKSGVTTDKVLVPQYGTFNGTPLYRVYVNEKNQNINEDFIIYFEVGYSDFNYSIDTLASCPINVSVREIVNDIKVSTGNTEDIEGSEQTIYTSYANSIGKEFNVNITPTTVIDASFGYSIRLTRSQAGPAVADGCPIEIWERVNNNWVQIQLVEDMSSANGDYITTEGNHPTTNRLYIVASDTLREQSVSGYTLTLTSLDNDNESTSFDLKLVKSVSADEFVFEDADVSIDSSNGGVTVRKTFTLQGQTSVEGLYVILNSENVTYSDLIIDQSAEGDDSVTFYIDFTLKNSSQGVTSVDSYQIAHENGLVSESFDIDIFLPLKSASVYYDNSNLANSMVDISYTNIIYDTSGAITSSYADSSIGSLKLKNGSTTPVLYRYNTANGQSAVADISISYYDFIENDTNNLARFKNLINTESGRAEIVGEAGDNVDGISAIANFSTDRNNIITSSVGYTYAVITFTGKGAGENNESETVQLVRIILIESFISADGLNIEPIANSQVSLVAGDTVAERDKDEVSKYITINFSNSNVTYHSNSNVEFVSNRMGAQNRTDDTVTWENGRYMLTNVNITDSGISFNIDALTTNGDYAFYDDLIIHYVVTNDDGLKVVDIYTPISITIRNAQRIEGVTWVNESDNGIYFEVGQTEPYYMLLDTTPTNAKNNNMTYVITDENGDVTTTFVSVSDQFGANTLAVNLPAYVQQGMTGYIYVLPEDAVYNSQIKFYYTEIIDGNETEIENTIALTDLGVIKDASINQTWFDFLVEKAYFKSVVSQEVTNIIPFADILIRTKVVVADGSSFEYAYRIYDNQSFIEMRDDLYYTVMTSLDLSSEERTQMAVFNGGLQGFTSDITIQFNGDNFASLLSESATIRNITFSGIIEGAGFVVDQNDGTIENVTVDVSQRNASILNATNYNYAGGIAAVNNGNITNVNILGLTINGNTTTGVVGGVVGQNAGNISGAKVEFYNLENRTTGEEVTYSTNKISGHIIGGLVGEMTSGSTLRQSYAYDYNLTNSSTTLDAEANGSAGGVVGQINETGEDYVNPIVDYVFSVVGVENLIGIDSSRVVTSNYYTAYYNSSNGYVVNFVTGYENNSNFIKDGDEGFMSYVNNGNPYLKDLYQDEFVSSVDYNFVTTQTNGYYKSIAVESNDGISKGILFNYELAFVSNELTETQQNDLDALNTISLASLIGEENVSQNIIITSSNLNIVKVIGTSIIVQRTGDVILTLSSKQNVEINKQIYVKVSYAISDLYITWNDISNQVNVVEDDSISYLQKTKFRDYNIDFENKTVVLGNTAERFDLVQNEDVNITAIVNPTENSVTFEKMSNSAFKASASRNSVDSTISITPIIYGSENSDTFTSSDYQNAINEVFERHFDIRPTDGVITFSLSGENLPITPSINGSIRVQIETTDPNDYIIPVVIYNDEELDIRTEDGNTNYFRYILPQDYDADISILEARISTISRTENTNTGVWTIVYDVNFAVSEDYKTLISQDMTFTGAITSISGNDSRDGSQNGTFEILVSRQDFTSIDVSNRKIDSSRYANSGNGYVTIHTTQQGTTGILAPGNSSILQVNVNPENAYYDYMEITYSGATVSNAVNIELVERYGSSVNEFVRASNSNVETVGSALRFTPTASEKESGEIFFKLGINSTVNNDSVIVITVSFYESEGTRITYANYYLTITYLKEPTLTVDGSDVAYLAKGSSAEIEITVLADQTIDTPVVYGDNVQGINISALTEHPADEIRGTKTYTATLYSTVLASVGESANNTFYIQANVYRELNGSMEQKTAQATVVLVDFKLDTNNISINDTNNNTLDVWLGVPKSFSVNYNLIPQEYDYDQSDAESVEAVQKLENAKTSFLGNQYYPAENVENANYYINYEYDNNRNLVVKTLEERLYFVINNDYIPINDPSIDSAVDFTFNPETNTMSVTGNRIASDIQLVLLTYVSAGGYTTTFETFFTVQVKAYSDPDLPLSISDAGDFLNLNPDLYSSNEIEQNDYILTNDIVLTEYTPFDTDLIRSLDGNGYTIYIKSYNVTPDSTETRTLNLALFNNVIADTTLKNVRVNIYNGGQLTIDISTYTTVNVAGFAITNEGLITNSEVVAFYSSGSAMGSTGLAELACEAHNKELGINIKYISGINTEDEAYLDRNSSWHSNIAGFVLTNRGNITNSRVGGDSITIIGDQETVNGEATAYTYATTQNLETFNIYGQGNIAGFVQTNAGAIAASFVKKLNMENKSRSTEFYSAGFAGTNSGTIITSYIEGIETPSTAQERSDFAKEGSAIKSDLGCIAGFIWTNSGTIKDSYSNILIANSDSETNVYLVSGFVYINQGTLENCYSASQIQNSKYTQMNFSGVDSNGDLLTEGGTYINCYFFNKSYEGALDSNNSTTENQFDTGALLITDPSDISSYYGFAVAAGESDGIWRRDGENGITLIETNNISISHRYILYLSEDSNYEGIVAEDDNGQYILPYSTLKFLSTGREVDTTLGSANNPILIVDAEDFVEVTGTSTSTNIQKYFNETSVWGTYRLVNNIDLTELISSDSSLVLPSTNKSFSGNFYGNGFRISGISINADDPGLSFGLFASIESRSNVSPIVTNLDMTLNSLDAGARVMVGGLAGYIKDAIIINIDITFNENALLSGLNYVGGLTGFAYGDNIIKNINVTNPNVTAYRYSDSNDGYFTLSGLVEFRTNVKNDLSFGSSMNSEIVSTMTNKYSYAGSVIGFVDNYSSDNTDFNISQAEDYSIDNVRVTGTVYVRAQVAGGIFGLTGYQTNVRDAGITITGSSANNDSHIIAMKYFAGGVIGQSFGSLTRLFATHDTDTQNNIENNMANFYAGDTTVERGILDLFYLPGSEYTQQYIGGLVGYVGSGKLDVSYSKLNVTSMTAQYAGGLIGGTDLQYTSTYTLDLQTSENSITPISKFLINEAYATGDIRANVKAGGIIGVIKGAGSRVALLSVNALNYFTTYDYETGVYNEITSNDPNTPISVSINYKVNSLVGSFVNVTTSGGNATENVVTYSSDDMETKAYNSYLILAKGKGSLEDDSDTVLPVASVAYYQYYQTTNARLVMNAFDNVTKEDINQEDSGTIIGASNNELIYYAGSAHLYNSAQTGHTYTQEVFLNSGVWLNSNWRHPTNQLFPSIRYQKTTTVLYLDAYEESISEVFETLSNGADFYTVVVRGLTSKDAEDSYDNIDLRAYFAANPEKGIIGEFASRLVGGNSSLYRLDQNDSYNTSEYDGEKVKIITDRAFIDTTAPGATFEDLTIIYTTNDTEGLKIENGLFVNGEISDATISNLKMIIERPVITENTDKNTEDVGIGLVAPVITNTTISGLTIKYLGDAGRTVLSIAADGGFKDNNVNVGLIAGTLNQTSTIKIMEVTDINFEMTTSSLIAVSSSDFNNLNVGSYFGSTEISGNAQDLRLEINNLVYTSENNYQMLFDGVSVTGNASIGGYIGQINGLGVIAFKDDLDNKIVNMDIDIDGNISTADNQNNINTLNVGLLFGEKSSATTLNFAGENVAISGGIYISASDLTDYANSSYISNLNAGGIIGNLGAEGGMTVSGLGSVDVDIKRNNTTTDTNPIVVNGTANVGLIAGLTQNSFQLTSTVLTPIGNSKNYILIQNNSTSSNTNIGALIGSVQQQDTSIDGIFETNVNINVSGPKVSEMTATANVGGFVGLVGGATGTNAKLSIKSTSYSTSNVQVTSNIGNINFGGILGYANGISGGSASSPDILINKTIFGGKLDITGANSQSGNLSAGGTIGVITAGASTVIDLQNNYNYGDVFVNYDENLNFNSLSKYYFGGLIGDTGTCSADSTVGSSAAPNVSLMTSHNYKYMIETDTAHAMFGNGVPVTFTQSSFNYYNHEIALLADNNAIDLGYTRAYNSSSGGYNGYESSNENLKFSSSYSTNSILVVFENCGINTTDLGAGHKLKPVEITTDNYTNLSTTNAYNGITYYVFDDDFANNTQNAISETLNNNSELSNIAIIGQGQQIYVNYTNAKNYAFIKTLTGFSSVSGVVLNVNNVIEVGEETIYSGLVQSLSGSAVVYASQVLGKIEVGSYIEETTETTDNENVQITSNPVEISSFVGEMKGGKIYDSSADVEILYRAAAKGSTYGFVKLDGSEFKSIENSYTIGSITTYVDVNMFAFTNGASNTTINNAYTATYLNWNDYENSDNLPDAETIFSTFGLSGKTNYTLNQVTYDRNALNVRIIKERGTNNTQGGTSVDIVEEGATIETDFEVATPKDTTTSTIYNALKDSKMKWYQDSNFNYYYPTLNYGYLKTSSYATITSTSTDGISGYDSYVVTNTYTRSGHNVKNTNTNAYYMVPNAGVLYMIFESDEKEGGVANQNYVLLNDIDLQFTEYSEAEGKTLSTTFTGNFDGQDHTIDNLKNASLFNVVGTNTAGANTTDEQLRENTIIRNLRLTNASNSGGILANTIYTATISNITISGSVKVTATNNGEYGAVANLIEGGEANTITNMATVGVTGSVDNVLVGGLFGRANNASILYCSNYGPVNDSSVSNTKVTASDTSESTENNATETTQVKGSFVGGIVGAVYGIKENTTGEGESAVTTITATTDGYTEITGSYNATSVLSNYATNSSLSTKTGYFYAGGIVGYAVGGVGIQNSYNSGMIKAGNKINNVESYAAGIIAYGNNANIILLNCYNEGNIEALGSNPETQFNWGNGWSLELVQTSERNVWAYGIGYLVNYNTADTQNCSNRDEDLISNNGAVRNNGFLINSWSWGTLTSSFPRRTRTVVGETGWSGVIVWQFTGRKIEIKYGVDYPNQNESYNGRVLKEGEDVYVSSRDSFGLPKTFAVKIQKYVAYNYYTYLTNIWGGGRGNWVIDGTKAGKVVSTDYWEYNFRYGLNGTNTRIWDNKLGITYDYFKNISISSNQNIRGSVNESTVKEGTRSSQTGTVKTTNIGGQSYYIADTNNLNNIFSAGLFIYETNIETTLPYLGNANYYELQDVKYTNGSTTGDVNTLITGISESNGNAVLTVRFYSSSEPQGTLSYTVVCNYNETLTFDDVSSLDYVYVNDYSIGIDVDYNGELYYPNGYTLFNDNIKDESGQTKLYNNIVKLAKEDVVDSETGETTTEPEELEDRADNYIYLVHDTTNNLLLYIPNAKLTNSYTNLNITVNIEDGFDITNSTQVEGIIEEKFNNKTYQMVGVSLSDQGTKYVEDGFKFSESSSQISDNINASGSETTDNVNIAYGSKVSNLTSSVNLNENFSYSVNVLLNNVLSNANGDYTSYTISNGSTNIATFTFSGTTSAGEWNVTNANTSITIDGTSYNLTVSKNSNYLSLTTSSLSATSLTNMEQVKNSIVNSIRNWTVTGITNATSVAAVTTQVSSTNIFSASHVYTMTLNTQSSDMIMLTSDLSSTILGYDASAGSWTFGSTSSIVINGHTFTLSFNNLNRQLTLTNNEAVSSLGISTSDIQNSFIGIIGTDNEYTIDSPIDDPIYENGVNSDNIEYTQGRIRFHYNNGSVEIIYTYDKEWNNVVKSDGSEVEIANYFDVVSEEDNQLKVKIDDEKMGSDLNSYSIGNITIYYGSLDLKFAQSYKTNIGQFDNSIKDNVIGVQVYDSNNNLLNEKQSYPFGSQIQESSLGWSFDQTIKIQVNYYASYELSIDDSETFGVALEFGEDDNKKQVRIAGTIAEREITETNDENNIYFALSTVSFIVDDKLISLMYREDNVGTEESPIYQKSYEYSYNNNIIFIIIETFSDKEMTNRTDISYTVIYDDSGNIIDEDKIEPSADRPEIIYIGDGRESIYTADLIEYKTIEDAVHVLEEDQRYVIYIDQGFSFISTIDSDSIEGEDEDYSNKVSYINTIKYDWNTVILPELNVVTNSLSVDYNDSIEISTEDNIVWLRDGNDIQLILRELEALSETNTTQIKATIKEEASNFSKELEISQNLFEYYEGLPIILMKDISFNSTTQFLKNSKTNIIGNGYYMSFYGSPLFSQLSSDTTNSFIKDLSLLGETYNASYFYNNTNTVQNLKVFNMNMYGTISGFDPKIDSQETTTQTKSAIIDVSNSSSFTIDNLNLYISINGFNSDSRDALAITLFNMSGLNNVNNYGVIVGDDGYDADRERVTGKRGMGIYATSSDVIITNNGIVKAGENGNGNGGTSVNKSLSTAYERRQYNIFRLRDDYYLTMYIYSNYEGKNGYDGASYDDNSPAYKGFNKNYDIPNSGEKGRKGITGPQPYGKLIGYDTAGYQFIGGEKDVIITFTISNIVYQTMYSLAFETFLEFYYGLTLEEYENLAPNRKQIVTDRVLREMRTVYGSGYYTNGDWHDDFDKYNLIKGIGYSTGELDENLQSMMQSVFKVDFSWPDNSTN